MWRATATPLCQMRRKGGGESILLEFSPIMAFRGVPWDSVAPRGLRFARIPPYGLQLAPTPRA